MKIADSIDPLAAAIDWLDIYRAGDVEAMLRMYADDAVIVCYCGGSKTITGSEGRRAYWTKRMVEYPVSALGNLQPTGEGALISYLVRDGLVSAVLAFNPAGKISAHTCGPSD